MYRKLVMRDGKCGPGHGHRIEEEARCFPSFIRRYPSGFLDELLLAASFNCGRLLTLNMGTLRQGGRIDEKGGGPSERCVGCMQCMAACATAHSRTKTIHGAILKIPVPRPRIHVGAGLYGEGFPNRCRHCDPAPCMLACLPGAINRSEETDTVLIDPYRCITALRAPWRCPFGVIRYHAGQRGSPGKS